MDCHGKIVETHSIHQNVSGLTISLHEKNIGNSLCVEYTVEKETCPLVQSTSFCVLAVFAVLLSVCVYLGLLVGILIFTLASFILLYNLLWDVRKEVLLVTAPLGLQFTAFFHSGQQTTCFIPWHCIKGVYIVEAISFHRVLYNLVVQTESEDQALGHNNPSQRLIPLFQGSKPRLSCLETIYRSIHGLISKSTAVEIN